MIETLMMVAVCLSFSVVSVALAFSFAMNAYLDWQEQARCNPARHTCHHRPKL